MVWSNAYSHMDIHAFEPRRQGPRPGKWYLNRAGSSTKSSFYVLFNENKDYMYLVF